MKKKRMCYAWGMLLCFERKNGLKMRFTLLFLVAGFLNLVASETYSQQTKLSISLRDVTVERVLADIEDNSQFNFVYNRDAVDIERKVDVNFSDTQIEDILKDLFKETNVTYRLIDRTIVLSTVAGRTGVVQSVKLTGKVTDTSGHPLPGVTVVVKGTTNGTITNFDGVYSLSDVPSEGIIQFSFVGMKMQEIAVSGKTSIDIVLEEDAIGIEEVVAIGYGTIKKKDLTGAVGSMGGNLVTERQTTQLSQALQGAISGVMVTRDNNSPGSGASIRIRGITTIGNSSPLILVDGIPVDNINDVHPNDVENISVLKDAASASIYGSRAASGVILITTKRAKNKELNLEYRVEYGIEKPTTLPEYVDAVRYMEMTNESDWNDKGNPEDDQYPTYAKDLIDNYMSLNKENPNAYPITDWPDIMFNNNAPRQSHVVNVSAGTNVIRSKANFTYDNVDGLYDGKTYERYSSRFSNDITINDYMDASIDFNYSYRLVENPYESSADIIRYGRMSAPIYAATWDDGRIATPMAGLNIYGQAFNGGYKNGATNLFSGKATINIKPLKGLKLSAVFSPQFQSYKGKNFRTQVPSYSVGDATTPDSYLTDYETTYLQETRKDYKRMTYQFLANYVKSFQEHSVNLMVGYENFYAYNESMSGSRDQYPFTTFPFLDIGPLEYRDNEGGAYESALRSYFGRIMYNYRNKYYLQGNIRYDGSSRFHSDYRWGTFPSFSAGWVISEENFFEDINQVSYLKLRGSWGKLGNERIGNYPYQATMNFSNALFSQGAEVVSAISIAQKDYAISDISWESTETYGVGFDAFFLNNKLRFTGDWYKKITSDMLLELEIPDYLGYDNPQQNTGKMFTNGWEFDLGWNENIGELNYSVSFNLSDFKSKMGNLGGIEFLGSQVKMEGSEFNEWYGYKSDGIYQTQEEVDNSATTGGNVAPGDIKYVDISGPDGIPDGMISPEYDRVLLGGSLPRFMYGSNIRMDYKGFDISLVIQGVGKQNRVMSTDIVKPLDGKWLNAPEIIDGKYWSHYNTEEQNRGAIYPRISYIGASNNYVTSDYWIFNGRYLRLKNVTIGYTLPKSLVERLKLRGVRVYANFSDVFTLSKYPKGWDPEVATTGYPITTSIIGGISIKF